jgi:hypothetical protein
MIFCSEDRLARIETKIDKLSDNVSELAGRISHLEGQWKTALWVVGLLAVLVGNIAAWFHR